MTEYISKETLKENIRELLAIINEEKFFEDIKKECGEEKYKIVKNISLMNYALILKSIDDDSFEFIEGELIEK